MKRLSSLLATLLLIPINAPADKDCEYIGSWFGYDSDGNIAWMSQANGKNSSQGTMLLELPGFDITFYGYFPDAVDSTANLKGTWKRTGGRSFSYAAMGFATDSTGDAVWAARLTGDVVVGEDCNTIAVDNTWLSFYQVDGGDPVPIWGEAPYIGPIPFAPHGGYRVELDNP